MNYLIITIFFFVLVAYEPASAQVEKKKRQTKITLDTKTTKILLQGSWFGEEYDEHAVFYIKDDTISYIEHFDKFKYLLSKDTFEIHTDNSHPKQLILKLTKDSLILQDLPNREISKYWKIKTTE